MYMGFWDRFKPQAPTPAQTQIADSQKDKDKSVLAAGSIYYVKWTDKSCTTSDTVKFYNERESRIFVNECKSQGYYVSTWTESLHEQVQSEVDRIKAELEQIYQKDIDRLKYKLHGLKTDCRSLQSAALYKSDVGRLQSKVNALTQERDTLKRQVKQLQEQASKQDNSKNQEQERKQIKALAKKIIMALDCSKVAALAEELADNDEFSNTRGNMQGRLIAYYAHKIIDI
jgi:transcription-repair coupling factor (superfamily II helicase)